jgi:hypothetical protein
MYTSQILNDDKCLPFSLFFILCNRGTRGGDYWVTGDGLGLAEVHLQYPRGGTRFPPSPLREAVRKSNILSPLWTGIQRVVPCTMDQINIKTPIILLIHHSFWLQMFSWLSNVSGHFRFATIFSLIYRSFSLQILAVSLRCEASEMIPFFSFQAKRNFRLNFNFRFRSENEGAP